MFIGGFMEKFKLDHWFVADNELSIFLMHYFVKITICKNSAFIFYRLEIFEDGKCKLLFNFNSLEDAVRFTGEVINEANSIDEIANSYRTRFKRGQFKDSPIKRKKLKN